MPRAYWKLEDPLTRRRTACGSEVVDMVCIHYRRQEAPLWISGKPKGGHQLTQEDEYSTSSTHEHSMLGFERTSMQMSRSRTCQPIQSACEFTATNCCCKAGWLASIGVAKRLQVPSCPPPCSHPAYVLPCCHSTRVLGTLVALFILTGYNCG